MAPVDLNNVSKIFPNRHGPIRAVDELSFDASDGELVVLVGPSGSGKTTVLRLVAGLERPSTGTIRIANQVVNRMAPNKRDVAMVFQSGALYPHMSVFNNLAFPLKMHRAPKEEIRRRVGDAAERLGLTHMLHRRPDELSGGERQRVALGRAMVRRPSVFLLDEPLSHLDAPLRESMRRFIRTLQRELAATMIYVTHDQREAMSLGDSLVVMNAGRAEQIGAPLEIYRRPANRVVAGFIGSPPMNFIEAQVEHGACTLRSAGDGVPVKIPHELWARISPVRDASLVLGIRPEDLLFQESSQPTAAEPLCDLGEVTIRFTEPLGDSTIVQVATCFGHELAVRCTSAVDFHAGHRIRLFCNPAEVHAFSTDAQGTRLI